MEWSLKWRQNGWRNAAGSPVANKPLIEYILTLLETRQRSGQPVKIEYVKGHSGNVGNDGADALAVAGCDLPEEPERDWVKLKRTYKIEKDAMHSIMGADLEVGSASSSLCRAAVILILNAGFHFERRGTP